MNLDPVRDVEEAIFPHSERAKIIPDVLADGHDRGIPENKPLHEPACGIFFKSVNSVHGRIFDDDLPVKDFSDNGKGEPEKVGEVVDMDNLVLPPAKQKKEEG
jgi:hypothetical protein